MKKRWICLFVENEIGVLARIAGLFSGKSYNLNSLTVGATEDTSISRMTISLTSDDKTFEQIKKQLNRSVEVIKVVDYTDNRISFNIFSVSVIDYNFASILLQCTQTEYKNNALISLLKKKFLNRIEITRGGSVAVEAIGISER